jgi:2-polyprenyl-3-methyl-5-hydroxy-6-metoxy-1,4-benzoquinol methylase
MLDSTKDFPDWETLYKSQRVETMPWYNENFDSDLEKELGERKITNNYYKFLDLGTGPATQAIWLAKRGFNVTGSDLSEAAVNRARKIYAKEKNVNLGIAPTAKETRQIKRRTRTTAGDSLFPPFFLI